MSHTNIVSDLRIASKDFPEHESIFEASAEVIESQGKSIAFYEECINTAIKDREYFEKERDKLAAINAELVEALTACVEAIEYMSEYDIPLTLPGKVKAALAKAKGAE